FKFSYLTVNLEDGITMPISVINAFRREALDKLSAKVMIHNKDRHHDLPQLTTEISPFSIDDQSINELTISVRDLKQLRAVVTHDKVSKIYYKDIKTLGKALELAKPHQKIIIPQLPRIINDEEIKFAVETIASLPIETVMVSEYGMLHALKAANPNLTILADFSFNTNNVQSIEALRQLGITAATLSYEMNQKQMRGLLAQSPLPMEAIVFTRIPMMITKHCPVKLLNSPNDEFCRLCLKTPFGLKDRKDKVMPLLRNGNCLTDIYNAQTLIWLEFVSDLQRMGANSFRLEFTNETESEMMDAIDVYTKAVRYQKVDKNWLETYKERDDDTKGHYHRGVE
ncbi:MAG: DUF3656 domain-containing U32 family peptidase, partial [Turicibacter sp.]